VRVPAFDDEVVNAASCFDIVMWNEALGLLDEFVELHVDCQLLN